MKQNILLHCTISQNCYLSMVFYQLLYSSWFVWQWTGINDIKALIWTSPLLEKLLSLKISPNTSKNSAAIKHIAGYYSRGHLKKFLEPAMFCHLAVLIYKGKVKDPRYMQNKKDPRISLRAPVLVSNVSHLNNVYKN